ncbi:hypothetical protein QTP88_009444 [Uroleucon formosanum]
MTSKMDSGPSAQMTQRPVHLNSQHPLTRRQRSRQAEFICKIVSNFPEGIERNYDVPEKQNKFIAINYLFCEQKFMYEQSLLYHLSNVHFRQHLNNVLKMIGSAMLHFTASNNHMTLTTLLYHLIRGFESKIECVDALNAILTKNCNAIQHFVNKQLNVLSRYRNVENVIKYVQDEELEECIINSDPSKINKIATNYTHFKFDKKIGIKVVLLKKQTIDILKSETVNFVKSALPVLIASIVI